MEFGIWPASMVWDCGIPDSDCGGCIVVLGVCWCPQLAHDDWKLELVFELQNYLRLALGLDCGENVCSEEVRFEATL